MKRRFKTRTLSHHPRRGSLVMWLLVMMITMICCVSLAVNSSYLSAVRSRTRQSAQAAALAAGRQVINDSLLHTNQQPFEIAGRELAAKNAAIQMGSAYSGGPSIPAITAEHIRITTDLLNTNPPLAYAPRRIDVYATNSQKTDASGRMFLGGIPGLSKGVIAVQATVLLNNEILGFQATQNSAIPLLPLALPDNARGPQPNCWSGVIENLQGADRWRWDSSLNLPVQDADRIPEIELTVEFNSAGPGKAVLFALSPQGFTGSDVSRQIETGFTSLDQQTVGEPILSFPHSGWDLAWSTGEKAAIAGLLRNAIGAVRIFPVYDVAGPANNTAADSEPEDSRTSDTPDAAKLKLLRPVAARILNVAQSSTGLLQVTVQPCVISTATAVLAGPGQLTPQNRYVWKICLAE